MCERYVCMCMCVYVYIYMYMFIYIYIETEREGGTEREKDRARTARICMKGLLGLVEGILTMSSAIWVGLGLLSTAGLGMRTLRKVRFSFFQSLIFLPGPKSM